MSDGMGRELAYLSSHATNRYFIPNWGKNLPYLPAITAYWKHHYRILVTQLPRNGYIVTTPR